MKNKNEGFMQKYLVIRKLKNIFVISILVITLSGSCAGLLTEGSALAQFEKGLSLFNRGKYVQGCESLYKSYRTRP